MKLYGFFRSSASYRARIAPNTHRSAGSTTVESYPSYSISVDSGGTITVDDELTLPNGDVPDIKRVNDHYDEDGILVYQEVLA